MARPNTIRTTVIHPKCIDVQAIEFRPLIRAITLSCGLFEFGTSLPLRIWKNSVTCCELRTCSNLWRNLPKSRFSILKVINSSCEFQRAHSWHVSSVLHANANAVFFELLSYQPDEVGIGLLTANNVEMEGFQSDQPAVCHSY